MMTASDTTTGANDPVALRDPARLLLPAVLLIEDDPNLGAMTSEMLQPDYRVDWVETQAAARDRLRRAGYDALIVDRRLPDGDGLDLVRTLRGGGMTVPVLVLTALSGVDDIVTGLDSGANDYLSKPFHFVELEARLRALLRGFHAQSASISIGDWTLKPGSNAVEDPDGHSVALTDAETKLLTVIAGSPDHVFSREELLGRVFNEGADMGTVDVYVSYVRGKTTRGIIDTVRGRGYRIGSPVAQ
ncbi:response regulator transcription factor [Bifidobacterium sp. 82T10]|uniref:Response regulator transcription factor n=1 Tax=Bifidobacterium miconis TaxID=2834435 RepID=A0ABS6WDU3_9BIFI|nr:response regulator transcription factor [Bifidobacterium miconis]MBW3092214.1 response regulator transcription factor [Bifidobacterium miconis]